MLKDMELVGEDLLRAYWSLYEGTRYNEQQWQKAVEETLGSLTQPSNTKEGATMLLIVPSARKAQGMLITSIGSCPDYQHWVLLEVKSELRRVSYETETECMFLMKECMFLMKFEKLA